MITTTKGPMDEALLEKRTGTDQTDQGGAINWIEYWDGEELVHRSVEIVLTGIEVQMIGGQIG